MLPTTGFKLAGTLYKHQKVKFVDYNIVGEKVIYNFLIDGQEVRLEFTPIDRGKEDGIRKVIYLKKWSCTCENMHWQGAKYNIECYHIWACITFLCMNEGYK